MVRRLVSFSVIAFLLVTSFTIAARPASAAVDGCFDDPNIPCIAAPFLNYWRDNGGLPIFGFPISGLSTEQLENGQSYPVQYFERARFELHEENTDPTQQVLLGAFGRLLYLTDPNRPQSTAVPKVEGADYFTSTGHNLGGEFRTYWYGNGGLARFGYPISEEFKETLENGQTYTVQYFERARFELHEENADPQYRVLLGLFGNRVLSGKLNANAPLPYPVLGRIGDAYSGGRTPYYYGSDAGVRTRLMQPTAAQMQVNGAFQVFERGIMVWRADTKMIYALALDGSGIGQWFSFQDTWDESQPAGGGPAPVPGRFIPTRGFGKVWQNDTYLQQRLGYATSANENGQQLIIQPFQGGIAIDAPGAGAGQGGPPPVGYATFLLYNNGRFELPFGYIYAPQ